MSPFLLKSVGIILFLFIGLYVIQEWRNKRAIKLWRKALDIKDHESVFKRLYENIDGFSLSKIARAQGNAIEYTYGEIEFESFIAIASITNPDTNTVFYDLGSGTGKAVIAMAMVFNIQKSIGIELFLNLHEAAKYQMQQLAIQGDYTQKTKAIEFIHNNILQQQFDDATLIFIQASVFIGELWQKLSEHLTHLKSGTLIISTTKLLLGEAFIPIHQTTMALSFGVVEVFIQRRQ